MNSQLQRERKRIARIGRTSADGENEECDFMSEILKSMDFDLENSKTINSLSKMQKSCNGGNSTENVSAEVSNTSVQHKIKMPKPPKKFLPEKKHPLMEKCQRNLKYLNHNRRVPKQRAHVSLIPNFSKARINKAPREKGGRDNIEEKQNINRKPNKDNTVNKDNIPYSCKNSSSDEDSESNFENFIRTQKETLVSDDSESDVIVKTKRKHEYKKKRDSKKEHDSKKYKSKNHARSAVHLSSRPERDEVNSNVGKRNWKRIDESGPSDCDSSVTSCTDDPGSPIVSKNKSKKHKRCRKSESFSSKHQNILSSYESAKSETDSSHSYAESKNMESNRDCVDSLEMSLRKLSDSDISDGDSVTTACADEMDFSGLSDSGQQNLHSDNDISPTFCDTENFNSIPRLTFDLTKADTIEYIRKHFTCFVRIKRNASVERRVAEEIVVASSNFKSTSSSGSVRSIEQSVIVKDSGIPKNDDSDVILLDSESDDDDCEILCVIPKTTNDVDLTEKNEANSESTGVSEFNIKISSIHSLRETGNLNPSVNTSENSANVISTADVAYNKIDNAFPEIKPQALPSSKNLGTVNEVHVSEGSKQNQPQVLIANLDELLTNIDFKLINQISKQSSISENSAKSIEKIPDVSVINKIVNQTDSIDNGDPFSVEELPQVKLKNARDEHRTSNEFQCNMENSSNSNHLNVIFDPTYFSTNPSLNLFKSDSVKDDHLKFCIDPSVCETINKIDFKKVLLVANSKQSTKPCIEVENCSDQSCSIKNSIQIQPAVIPEKTQGITFPVLSRGNNFRQDLKSAGNRTDCVSTDLWSNSQIVSKTEENPNTPNSLHSFNSSRAGAIKNESLPTKLYLSESKSVLGNRNSELKENNINYRDTSALISVRSQHAGAFYAKNKTFEINPVKREHCENPSDELDIIAATSIRELCEQKPSIAPLFNLYDKELKHYDEIVSTEKNVSAGLKMLEEKQATRIKHLTAAINNIVQHDPCFHEIKEEKGLNDKCSLINTKLHADYAEVHRKPTKYASQEARTEDETRKDSFDWKQGHLKQIRKCANCGRQAKFLCQRCKKVFYCSSECGIYSWEKEHSANCF